MKKKFTFLKAAFVLLAMMASTGMSWATDVTFSSGDYTGEGTQSSGSEFTMEKTDVSITNTKFYGNTDWAHFYANGTTTITPKNGVTITEIVLTAASSSYNGYQSGGTITATTGSVSGNNTTVTWSGSATDVFTISNNKQIRWTSIVVTYSTSGGTPTVATPTFNPGEGTYTSTQTVEISCTTEGATIYYTLDGNDPTTESAEYTEALTIEETTTVKAFAVKEDYNNSAIATATYTITAPAQGQIFSRVANHAVEAGQTYLIVDVASGRALTSANGSSNAPAAVEVTIENDQINTDNTNLQWTFEATDGGYIIYPLNSTTTWLYSTDANNGVRVGTNDNKVWALDITDNANPTYHGFKNTNVNRYLGVYFSNNAPQDWRAYGTINNNIKNTQIELFVLGDQPYQPTPTITAANVDLAYDAEEGTISYTVNNPVDGGVLTAEVTDGYEWISADEDEHTEATGTVALITDANITTTVRTATVTLTYTYENRETVTKTVTVTQAAAPVIYTTIPALFEAATNTETDVTVTFGGWVISAVKNSNAYLTDNAGNGLIIYQSDHGFQVNDVLTGTASCKLQAYRGSAELKNLTATTEGLTVTPNGTVTVQNIAISELSGVNTGALVAYENLTYTDGKLQDSEGNQITPYTTLYDYGNIFVEGHIYNVTGIYLQYNSTKEILPRSADDIEEVTSEEPTITVTPAEFTNVMYEGETLEATVAWENFEGEYLKDFVYYESDGETPVQNTWFEIQGEDEEFEQIYILVEPNDGAARTGYFKAYAVTTDGEYYSNLVTISQEAYSGPVEVLYSYSINGVEGETISYTGESITLDDSDNLEGFNFVGWTLDPNDVDNILYAEDQFTFEDDVTVFYAVYEKAESKRDGGSYVKVTSTDDIENGNYLIVYEDGNVAFDGGLDSFDATENTIEVEITNGQIASSSEVMAAAFTIEEMEGGYSIQGASGKYISVNGFNNGLVSSETPAANAIDFENDNVLITRTFEAGTMTLKFNSASNQLRFRYYKSGQQDIQLYKYTSDVETPTRFTRVFIGETVAADIDIVGPSIIPAGEILDMGENYMITNDLGANRLIIEDGAQLKSILGVEATMQKNINGYADENTASGYYLIATPIMVEYNNTAATNLASNTYDLYAYEQSQELEWRNFKNADNDLSYLFPGEGYLYANSETMTLEIRGELTVAMDDVISLAYSDDGLKSLNLVGNPLPHNVTLGAYDAQHNQKTLNFLTMNDAGDGFITTTANQFNAVPMQGFFVQATAEGLHLEQVVTGGTSPGFDDEEEFGVGPRPNSLLNITLHNGGNLIDNAIIFFANGSMMNKYYLNENSTRLYIPQGNQEFAVVGSNGQGEMPVNFKPAANGNYTINVNMKNVEMDYLHLIDNLTGADIDLLANPSYSFEANTNDYATRFRIVFSADFVANDNDSNFAYFNGSEYVVSNQGQATLQVVDVMGRIISSQTISGNAEVNVNEACGVYMLRLVNGDSVKTQKIVIQ